MARLVLAISGLIFLAFGLAFLADPLRFLGTLGPLTASPDLVTDLRAIYGGLNTGLGVGLLASVRVPALHRPGLALIAATLGVVAVGRAAGMLTSGFDRSVTPVFLGLEALGAVLAAVAWWRLGRAAR